LASAFPGAVSQITFLSSVILIPPKAGEESKTQLKIPPEAGMLTPPKAGSA